MLTRRELATIAHAIRELTSDLQPYSDTPRLDAELIIAHALERPRSFLYTYPEQELAFELQELLFELLKRRSQGEPIAYITGNKEFWSLELTVTKDTLIPRPETEHLVEWALDNLPLSNAMIADLGTGSGAIAIALASERPQWTLHATDASAAALNIAIDNARHHQLNNIEFYFGPWYSALPQRGYTAIISNPPYIAEDDPHLDKLGFEPLSALMAHEQGLAAFKAIIQDAKQHLAPDGKLILEHGYNQAPVLVRLLQDAGFQHIESHCDLAKQTRFVVGVKLT
jgi:release factor glutamine methyltransferase